MLKTTTFKGANVFMSRNLVPPEIFDALHDALKLNGANVFLCCDPSRTGPDDYHVIASSDHVSSQLPHLKFLFYISLRFSFLGSDFLNICFQEKFEDLRAKGCNLLGMFLPNFADFLEFVVLRKFCVSFSVLLNRS